MILILFKELVNESSKMLHDQSIFFILIFVEGELPTILIFAE